MDHLHRQIAPITESAWRRIDEELAATVAATIAGRKVFDVEGPMQWSTSSVDLGRTKRIRKAMVEGAEVNLRVVQPLIEFRVPFEVKRTEINAIARGAADADLDAVVRAGRTAALAEDFAIFHGYSPGNIDGVVEEATNRLSLRENIDEMPDQVAEAVSRLRTRGVGGPYVLVLGPRWYESVARATHSGGYPVTDHLSRLVEQIVWAPALGGALVLSRRGGDYRLVVGSDFQVGYSHHDASTVHLYVEESFTFVVQGGEAGVPLLPDDADAVPVDLQSYISGDTG